ncbi:MAG: hypothetical protein CL840_19440 [Crocinitomicaceae bacterium]|nr:hypothetical protein [Crocinitomicaceae bacterium]|tara:strand:- start:11495 stop:16987 length:5493 start_codon:yes stop_codon:yes gene_type:complete
MKKFLLVFVAACFSSISFAQMSGSYTIGGTGANFSSVVQAVDTLNANGVNGAVVFNIRSGTYTGQAKINNPTGTSATNTVLFRPDTGNTAAVIIQHSSTSTTNNGTVILNGSKYISFDSLTIRARGSSYSTVVGFQGAPEKITFNGCKLEGYAFATTSTWQSIIYDNSGSNNQAKDITFKDNDIKNGSYGVYSRGASTSNQQTGWKITNNRFTNQYYMGAYFYYTNVSFNGNSVKSPSTGGYRYPYGAYFYYCYNTEVRKNNIQMVSSGATYSYGVYMYYCHATSSSRKFVANNMVYCSKSYYAFYFYRPNYVDFVHNTVKSGTGYNCLYTLYYYPGTNNNNRNNIFYNSTGGYAMYQISNPSARTHNNYYSTGTATNFTRGSTEKTLDPMFVSTSDLHITNIALNNSGTNISAITTDIDGDARTSSRDMGADEVTPDTLDLKLLSLKQTYCSGSQSVKLDVMNFGLDTIKSAKISWKLAKNGGTPVTQTPYAFSGNLVSGAVASWTLGTFTFNLDTTYQIWAYIDTVNSRKDLDLTNDTTQTDTFRTALSGVYTVGGSMPDYATPALAVAAAKAYGLCGATTFKIRSGTYNAALTINNIPGISSTNTLRFTSDTGATQPVITSTTMTPTLRFDGISYVTFDRLSLTSRVSGGTVAEFTKKNTKITFDSCYMRTDTNSTGFNCRVISNLNNNPLHGLTVKNSKLIGGYYSVYLRGNNTTALDSSFTLTNSELLQFYYYGIYQFYCTKPVITKNKIDNWGRRLAPSFTYGVYMYYTDHFKLNGNYIRTSATQTPYSLYIYYCDGTSSSRSELRNNMITAPRKTYLTSRTFYNIRIYNSRYMDFQYNNILLNSGGAGAYCAYVYGPNMNLKNNNITNLSSGYAYYRLSTGITETYNNIYAPNGTRSNVGFGTGTINVDPEYISDHDLHVQSISLNNTGNRITGITTDYDGDTRATTPDIGADEFTPPANDLRPYAVISPEFGACGQDSADVIILVKNNGTATQTTQPTTVIVTSPIRDTLTATGSKTIATNRIDTVRLGKINTSIGGNFTFKLITSLSGDQRKENDTLEITGHKIFKSPRNPVVGNNIVVCNNIDTGLFANTNANRVYWYEHPDSASFYTGDTLVVNKNSRDTLWVRGSDDYKSRLGILNNSVGFGNYLTVNSNYGLRFDVVKTLTIDTVTVYQQTAGNVRVRLYSSGGTTLEDTTFAVNSAGIAKLPIGFKVIPGKGYKLDATGSNTRLYYTYSGVNYPYRDIDSAIFITAASNGSTRQYYFFYDWKISVEGCESDLVKVPIDVRPSLTVNIGPDTGYCVGSTFNYTLNATTTGGVVYKWQNNTTAATYTVNSGGTYWVDVTSGNGCVSRDSVVVSVVPIPTVTFTGGHYCTNQGGLAINGSPGPGRISGSGVSNNLYYPGVVGVGSHSLTYTYTDSIGCSNSAVGTMVVDTAPAVTLTPPPTICQNKLSVPLSGGAPAGGYYFGKNIQGNKILPKTLGVDTINYVYYSLNGCHDTAQKTVTIISSPQVTWANIPDQCQNTPPFTLNGSPAGGIYSGPGISGSTYDPAAGGVGLQKLSYTVTGGNGCSTVETKEVRVYPKPYVSFGSLVSACEHEKTYKLVTGGPGGGTYSGAHVDPVTRTFDVQAAGPGTYPIVYMRSNQYGCKDSLTQNLVINPTPKANFGGDKQICGGQTVTLDAQNTGGKFLWNTGDTTQTLTISGNSGSFIVTITANGCRGVDSVKVSYEATCVGIDQKLLNKVGVNIYPNPSNGVVNLKMTGFENMDVEFVIHAVNGQKVFEVDRSNLDPVHNDQIDLTGFNDGVYLLYINTSEGSLVYRLTISR